MVISLLVGIGFAFNQGREWQVKPSWLSVEKEFGKEVADLVDGVTKISELEGKIIENTSMNQLLKQLDSQVFTIETSSNLSNGFSVPGYDIKIEADNKFSITLPKGSSVNNLFSKPELAQIEVTNIANQTNRLEQLFLNLTAKS